MATFGYQKAIFSDYHIGYVKLNVFSSLGFIGPNKFMNQPASLDIQDIQTIMFFFNHLKTQVFWGCPLDQVGLKGRPCWISERSTRQNMCCKVRELILGVVLNKVCNGHVCVIVTQ